MNNGEILLIYEAENCNPNGDPMAENRPRVDLKTMTNIVTDVRLKRFFRDMIISDYGEEWIYVSTVSGKHVTAEEKLMGLKIQTPEDVLRRMIDVRLFGAMIPWKRRRKDGGKEERGESISFTGPVQFTYGFSFHRVALQANGLTNILSGAKEGFSTIGIDWKVKYSLIGFYGTVSGRNAARTMLGEEDLMVLDDVLWKALLIQTKTRSKIGEEPCLYIRLRYNSRDVFLGDLRRYVRVREKSEYISGPQDLEVDFSELAELFRRNANVIERAFVNVCDWMKPAVKPVLDSLGGKAEMLPHGVDVGQVLRRLL